MASLNIPSFPSVETLICPKCDWRITSYDLRRSDFFACPSCKSYLGRLKSSEFIVKGKLSPPVLKPVLPLGSTGVLKEIEFKVICYLEKKERNTVYCWREYLLYSPEKEYVTLAEFDGHWSFIGGKDFFPDLAHIGPGGVKVLPYNGSDYRLFNKYAPVVTAMVGEADWDVLNEKIAALEFVAPPFMLVKEKTQSNPQRVDYYLAEYLELQVIAEAFKLDQAVFPVKTGIGAIQPSRYYERWNTLFPVTGIAVVVILLLQLLFTMVVPEQELINDDFDITAVAGSQDNSFKPFITPAFNLGRTSSNIEFTFSSRVDNNWLEATIVLINEESNKTWEVTKGMEYYHGVEDGESWDEGSRETSVLISDLPKGKYHLNVYPASGDQHLSNLYIRAVTNVNMWRNTLITIFLLLIYPAFCWYMMTRFEKKRWDNSDHSPFVN